VSLSELVTCHDVFFWIRSKGIESDPLGVFWGGVTLLWVFVGKPNIEGKRFFNSEGMQGMQAQMIATSHSTTLQYIAGVLSSDMRC
jgi:hypothetical protein